MILSNFNVSIVLLCFSVYSILSISETPIATTPSEIKVKNTPEWKLLAWIKEQGHDEILFDFYQSDLIVEDRLVRETKFVDRSNSSDAFIEKIVTDISGLKLYSYEVEQIQIDEKGSLLVDHENKKVSYKYYKNKKWKENSESFEGSFLVGGMIPDFIVNHKVALDSSQEFKFSLAVPYMNKSFQFKIEKQEDSVIDNIEYQIYKMSPTHFLVSAVTKPLYFKIPKNTKKVQKIFGRLFLKKLVKKKYESFQGETHFLDVEAK